jgi:uncharacterized membrane protein
MSQAPPGMSGFEHRLMQIAGLPYAAEEKQSRLLMVLIREVHTVKWILWWVLIIVPIIAVVLGVVLTAAVPRP